MYCDDNHLSPYGSRKMVSGILDQLFPGMESTVSNWTEAPHGKTPNPLTLTRKEGPLH